MIKVASFLVSRETVEKVKIITPYVLCSVASSWVARCIGAVRESPGSQFCIYSSLHAWQAVSECSQHESDIKTGSKA